MSATLIVVGLLVLAAGVGVLTLDQRRRGERRRDRKAWAGRHTARYAESDPVITGQWRHGVFSRGGSGRALELVSREHDGSRLYVFDLEQGGVQTWTIVALRRPTASDTTLELRLGSSAASQDSAAQTSSAQTSSAQPGPAQTAAAGMDLLGPVGERYAFTDDLEAARGAVDKDLVPIGDAAGKDVSVLWAEGSWALAALDIGADTERWDELAEVLGDFAELMQGLPAVYGR